MFAKWRYCTVTLPLIMLLAAGCGGGDDDGTGPGQQIDLSGTYTLVSLTFEGQPTVEPPVATGQLVLTQDTYQVSITIQQGEQPLHVTDSGTYQLAGTAWSQTSTERNIQSVGTFTFDGTILTVDVTTAGTRVTNVWRKTG